MEEWCVSDDLWRRFMRKSGILLCCGAMLTLSIVIALSKVTQYIDMLKGDFYISAFRYISILQWIMIAVPFLVGFGIILSEKKKSKQS